MGIIMEDNELQVNEKLYSFDGVIGRHAYLVNMVIICALSSLIVLPYTTYLYTHLGSFEDLFEFPKMFLKAPLILKLWVFFGTAGVCTLSVSNIFRRLNDIIGEKRTGTNIAICAISVLASFSFLLPFIASAVAIIISFVIGIVLLFTRGKITGLLPYDYKKEFNWGAFFGTWIWGLFNKTYITLWELILWLTPLSFYFQLYCGLKGNEWAFKNKNCTDVKEFNKSQETQATVFAILSLVVIPILYVLLIIGIIAIIAFFAVSIDSQTPQSADQPAVKKESFIDNMMNGIISLYFERYEITDDENKFYISNDDWETADFKDKKDMLDLAASKSAELRREKFEKEHPDKYEYFSKTNELPRTKIYSSTSGALLGEFVMNEKAMNGSFKDALKAALQAYRFYNVD